MELVKLSVEDKEEIKALFAAVFMNEPWNDDWSDESQLDAYITDLIGNGNSLSLGLTQDGALIGAALGAVKHWFIGTEYYIEELFIRTDAQGRGAGSAFIEMIRDHLGRNGIRRIFLQTERSMPAYSFYLKRGFIELTDHVSFISDF